MLTFILIVALICSVIFQVSAARVGFEYASLGKRDLYNGALFWLTLFTGLTTLLAYRLITTVVGA